VKVLLRDHAAQLDSTAITYLERLQRASNRLDLLIRDVLAYSTVAKAEIQLRPIALEPLLEDVLLHLPSLEGRRECVSVEGTLHTVLGHEAYLSQVLTNLIANALKFVGPGSTPRVRIRSERIDDQIRTWVCDNGIGIHPDHYDRIFQIFGRVHSTSQFEGTGIGLAIVKKAVARMGGETGFASEPGKGSQFWFTLQAAPAPANPVG
jgi:signal transduction histidine kinase